MSDDHCEQAIGVYGSRLAGLNPTPNLDQLARNGMVFDNVFCTNSICIPSRATIMTGQYSHVNKVYDLYDGLPRDKHYLSEKMQEAGYATAVVGKWHLRESPRFFDYLRKNDLMKNTIIVYTSDQGMLLGEHDFIDKRWMYEESIRMPLIMHYPPMIKPNSRNDWLINNTDYAPTLLELAGIEPPDYMQGKSFVDALQGRTEPESWRKGTYYRYWMHMAHGHNNPAHFGIRTKKHKLIFF